VEFREGKIQNQDLAEVVDTVKRCIKTYDIVVTPLDLYFYYFPDDNPDLHDCFESIRKELVPKGYIPFLSEETERFIVIRHRPEEKYRSSKVNLILFILTLASTIYVGSLFSLSFIRPGPLLDLEAVIYGFIFFSGPLLLILGIHEIGHYIVARRYSVKASFPFFIPVPISIGTFGAFISLRDPIPNRKAMVEIGAAGPIFGFMVALPLLFVANYLQKVFVPISMPVNPLVVQFPLIYHLLGIIPRSLIPPVSAPIFPMELAVWVGMFATALNLIPISQLDGGHVSRGMLGRRSYIVSYIFLGVMLYFALQYTGWIIIVLLAVLMGISHPPPLNDYQKLSMRDYAIGACVLAMFILTFTITPIISG
jgi:membrane-associated protease RseP (regulator of RpoE activity)